MNTITRYTDYNPFARVYNDINLTIFSLIEETWQRFNSTILEKCYTKEEIISALETTGFSDRH
ncbi:hypothetical protein [Nostoc sp.]|uniref:hypothetical protein n=1 Tax=Nostoc sp. TaxID=1180 RepID=UPI002FFD1C93